MQECNTGGRAGEPLSRISTHWDVVAEAHRAADDAATAARHELLLRYGEAVYRYLRVAVRDPQAADDLSQEFAVRWLSGGFRHADPSRGRFRNYLSTALHHLVIDHFRRKQSEPIPLNPDSALHPPAPPESGALEEAFVAAWRRGVLDVAWRELERTDEPQYAVLKWRATNPDETAEAFAERLSVRRGRPHTAAGVRQTLRRARKAFAELLVAEVARSLGGAPKERVERELDDLGLLGYCRPILGGS